ncbi:acetyltransferase [Vibrio cholerae]|nr:acetyltransferase [Vibrio cholerae]
MVAVVVFEFGCMRCQPLRRALVEKVRPLAVEKNYGNE